MSSLHIVSTSFTKFGHITDGPNIITVAIAFFSYTKAIDNFIGLLYHVNHRQSELLKMHDTMKRGLSNCDTVRFLDRQTHRC